MLKIIDLRGLYFYKSDLDWNEMDDEDVIYVPEYYTQGELKGFFYDEAFIRKNVPLCTKKEMVKAVHDMLVSEGYEVSGDQSLFCDHIANCIFDDIEGTDFSTELEQIDLEDEVEIWNSSDVVYIVSYSSSESGIDMTGENMNVFHTRQEAFAFLNKERSRIMRMLGLEDVPDINAKQTKWVAMNDTESNFYIIGTGHEHKCEWYDVMVIEKHF